MMATRQVLTKLALAGVLAVGGALGFTSTAHALCTGDGTPDGVWDRDGGEECDDGNNIDGDGCDNNCTVSNGYLCDLSIPFESLKPWAYNQNNDNSSWSPGFTSRQQNANTNYPTYAYMGINAADIGDTILELYVDQTSYDGDGLGNPPNADDDWVGFVLGFDPDTANTTDGEYLLIDWKALLQRYNISGNKDIQPGMRISHVKGLPRLAGTFDQDFYLKTDQRTTSAVRHIEWATGSHTNTLPTYNGRSSTRAGTAGNTYGSTGWKHGTQYQFRFEYSADQLKVEVREGETGNWQIAFELTAQDAGLDEFPNGEIGFYGLSQPYARYSLIEPLYSVCEEECNDGQVTGNEECDNQDPGCNLNTCRWSVEITDPADQSYISENRPVISGEGSANANIRVTFTDENDNVLSIVNTTTDANGAWSVTPDVDLPEGLIDVQVRQRDERNSDTYDDISIQRLDLSVTITDPNDGETYGGPTYSGTVPVSGNATPSVTHVTLYIDGVDSGVTAPVDPTTHTWGPVNLPIGEVNGDYNVQAVGTGANNITVDSQTIVLHVDADTFVTIHTPAHGSTHDASVGSISGTGEPGADVSLTIENGETLTTTVGNDGNWTVTLTTPLTNDTFTATATITDPLGNTDTDVSTFTVHINACTAGTATCDDNATCEDSGANGAYTCTCNTGYTGDGQSCHITLNPIDDNLYLYVDGSRLFDPLLNDEGEINPSTFELVDPPQHGTITGPDANGFYNYVVEDDYVGTDTATYKICDVHGDCENATLNIYISDTFKPQDYDIIVLEGTTTSFNPLTNDGPDAVRSTMTIISGPTNGTLRPNDPAASGQIAYKPNNPGAGTDTIVYKVCADSDNCGEATINITINDKPTLDDETRVVTPGGTQTIDVAANADPGEVGTIVPESAKILGNETTPNGTCSLQNGKLTFVADADATLGASDVCKVNICEDAPQDACVTGTFTFEVAEAFTPTADTIQGAQGQTATTPIDDLLSNDGNVDKTTFILNENSTSTGLSVTDDGQGNIQVSAEPNAPNTGTFTYTICSAIDANDCDDVTVTVNIAQKPEGTPSESWTIEDTRIDVPSPYDSNVDITVDDTNVPGTVSIQSRGNPIRFTPDSGFVGEVTIPVTGCTKTDPAACSTTDITVFVNDLPTLDDQTRIVTPDGSQTIDIVASADPGQVGDIDPSSAKLTSNASTANGTCAVQNGKLTFEADADAALGASDTCTVEICEEQPDNACTSATYTFEIQDVFNPTEDELSTTQDTPMAFLPEDLLKNDGNTDDDSFEIIFDEDPENPGVITTTEGGTITYDDTTGEYTYTPPADFTGEDSFTYKVCSGLPNDDTCADGVDAVEVTITVHDLPTVDDTTIWVVTETPSVDVDVQDLYTGGPIGSITTKDQDGNPTGDVKDEDGNTVGTVTVDGPTNTLTFTPNDPSNPAVYDIVAEVCDEAGVCEDTAITIIYNDPPNTQDPDILVEPGTDKAVSFEELTQNSDTADIDGGWDETSILVSNLPDGPFGQDADLGDDNACAIIDGELVYTLAEDVELGDHAPTCFVQVCEADPGPRGTNTTDRACSIIDVTPTAGIETVITGPKDGETLEADEPTTVTGTGEPGTEITITIDDEPVGTTTVDDDGNWEFPLEDPLSPGEHTIVAEGENGSKDKVTVNVNDPAAAETPIAINGPKDGATLTPDEPVTVTGTGTPGTEVTISVDGEPVGTTTVDEDGNWEFPLEDPLSLGEHTITAEDENGDKDQVKVTVKEDDGNGDPNSPDPNVALTGGRFLSCAATDPSAPTGGLVLLTFAVAAFLARRRREAF